MKSYCWHVSAGGCPPDAPRGEGEGGSGCLTVFLTLKGNFFNPTEKVVGNIIPELGEYQLNNVAEKIDRNCLELQTN